MKFNVGDIIKMSNGSEYKVIEIAETPENRVLIKGKTGIGYWLNAEFLNNIERTYKAYVEKDVNKMSEQLKVGDEVVSISENWCNPSKIKYIEGAEAVLTSDFNSLTVRKLSDLKKFIRYPYRMSKVEVDEHMKKIGTNQIMLTKDKIKQELYTVHGIIDRGPIVPKDMRYQYIFGSNDSFLYEQSIKPDNGLCEYMWYKPHPLTDKEKKILKDLHGSLKFKTDGWKDTVFEIIGYGFDGKYKSMDAYQIKDGDNTNMHVLISSIESGMALDGMKYTWIDERKPPMKAIGVGYLRKGENSKLFDKNGNYTNYTGTALGDIAEANVKVRIIIEEIRD
jgi:hypothetical protein